MGHFIFDSNCHVSWSIFVIMHAWKQMNTVQRNYGVCDIVRLLLHTTRIW